MHREFTLLLIIVLVKNKFMYYNSGAYLHV